MNKNKAYEMHQHVPPNWYWESIKVDTFQRIWHKSRFKQMRKMSEPADYVLDAGCADGIFTKMILDATGASKIIGVDIVGTSIDWAKKHWKRNIKMHFQTGDIQTLKFPNESFDAVYCMEVLEHLPNPKKTLFEFKRVLKKGGYCVFLVPTDNYLFKIVWWLWLHFYPRGWVWKETHIQSYKGNFLPKLCREVGFKVEMENYFNLGMLTIVKVRK